MDVIGHDTPGKDVVPGTVKPQNRFLRQIRYVRATEPAVTQAGIELLIDPLNLGGIRSLDLASSIAGGGSVPSSRRVMNWQRLGASK